jgi:serine/threonine-protein kinase
VRYALSPDILADPLLPTTPALAAEREVWAQVRSSVQDLRVLAPDEADRRVASLRVSSDPVAQQIVNLLDLRDEARGFLEPPLPTASTLRPATPVYSSGQLIGPYRIVSVLGEGGMGRVYRAEDTRLLRPVALKVLTTHKVRGATLLREAQMAARLHHPNIATVHDVLEADGHLHIVMEYLQGRSLARMLEDEPVTVERVTSIFGRMLAAVRHAHDSGVIHCDLKPANVFVVDADQIKVLDFGLARLDTAAATGEPSMAVAGTPRYLAPERVFGAHPSASTDIYSLGVILVDMLRRLPPPPSAATAPTGTVSSVAEVATQTALRAVATRAIAHDPGSRFASVAAMEHAFTEAVAGRVDWSTPFSRPALLKWAAAAVVLALAAGLLISILRVSGSRFSGHATVAVGLSAVGNDPVSSYVAAAMQQVLEHSMMGAPDVTVVRQASAGADELGATHVLSGTVEHVGPDVRVQLSLTDRVGTVLALQQLSSSLSSLSTFEAAIVSGADTVLARAGLRLDRKAIADALARRALSFDQQAFEDYAQAREYLGSPDVPDYLDHAITLLRRSVERDAGFALAHAGLAEAYWEKYQNTRETTWTDRARASALDALRLNPDDPIVRYTLALIYRGMGRRDDALTEITRAIALQPSNDDLFRLRGLLHADGGQIDTAMADLHEALRLRAGFWDNHRTAGMVLYQVGRYDEAIPYFRRVTELRPSNASAFQALGTVYHAANHIPEALAAYNSALALAPNANTYSNLGMLHYANGNYVEARHAYEESIRLRPKSAITHRNLGDTLQKLGLETRARAEYERAISLAGDALAVNPQDLESISLQALCHAKIGHRGVAAELASRVLSDPSPSAAARYRAGVAQVLAGIPSGVTTVVQAIQAGYSKSVAAQDDDLASVRKHPDLAPLLK